MRIGSVKLFKCCTHCAFRYVLDTIGESISNELEENAKWKTVQVVWCVPSLYRTKNIVQHIIFMSLQ